MDTPIIVLWTLFSLTVIFELVTTVLALKKRNFSVIIPLSFLAVQIIPFPILSKLVTDHPQPYADTPWNINSYGYAFIMFNAFDLLILVPAGLILTLVIFFHLREVPHNGIVENETESG